MFRLLVSRLAFSIACAFLSAGLQAAEMEFRTWTSGTHQVEAKCVSNFRESLEAAGSFQKAKVTLETRDGRRIVVGFLQLGQEDRDWLMARFMGAKIQRPGQQPKPAADPTKPSFELITEKDVNDPGKLLQEYDPLGQSRAGNFESQRFLSGGMRRFKETDFSQLPPWASMAAAWIDSATGVMALPENKTFEQALADARKAEGWRKPFKEAEINEVLAFLAANNRTNTGLISFQRVFCRTEIVPTPEELEKYDRTFAYAQLELTVHAEKKADEKIAVVFDALVDGKFYFMHRGVSYSGELQKIEREAAKRFDVRRSDGWCVKWLREMHKAAGADSVLLQRVNEDNGVLLIGEKFGKMWTVCPEFITPK